MKKILHRVDRKREPTPPALPKEVTPIGPRTYVDRWGVEFLVVWQGSDDLCSSAMEQPR
jgi:hypothetical protein